MHAGERRGIQILRLLRPSLSLVCLTGRLARFLGGATGSSTRRAGAAVTRDDLRAGEEAVLGAMADRRGEERREGSNGTLGL